MKLGLQYLICLCLIGIASLTQTNAQVSLAPTALFISDQSNVASLYVSNNSNSPQEITVSFEFSYPGSDKLGNMTTEINDSLNEKRYGLVPNLKAFPRQFVLQAGAKQTVRIQVRPLKGKPEGMYWSRVIVSSQTAAKDIDTVKITEGIGTKINYVFKQNIPAFYRKGKVSTGLIAGAVTTAVEDGKLVAIAKLKPTGNAPFNGSVKAILLNSAGSEVASQSQTMVAYFEVLRRIELSLPKEGLAPGKYTLDFTYETKRNDISPTELVQAAPVKTSVAVEIK